MPAMHWKVTDSSIRSEHWSHVSKAYVPIQGNTYFNKVVLPAPVAPRNPTRTLNSNSFSRASIASVDVLSVTPYTGRILYSSFKLTYLVYSRLARWVQWKVSDQGLQHLAHRKVRVFCGKLLDLNALEALLFTALSPVGCWDK